MFRILGFLSLRLLIVFGGVGLLVSHAWGWSEYASPELYVVYFQLARSGNSYFIVGVNDDSTSERITAPDDAIRAVDCSPDGRIFTVLTMSNHLYVIDSNGLRSDTMEAGDYTTVDVANNGAVALFQADIGRLIFDSQPVNLRQDLSGHALDRVDITSQGLMLWNRDFRDIRILALANGEAVGGIDNGYSGEWLASEHMYTFASVVLTVDGIITSGGQYIADLASQRVVRIGGWTMSRPISPDGTRVAAAIGGSDYPLAQIVVYDLFTNDHRVRLTHDATVASQPICFLTFRPQMLIAPLNAGLDNTG